tara:strand:+ start:84 stop:803 length:720 start_codon:yes stop_codon:yes gene_type:complete
MFFLFIILQTVVSQTLFQDVTFATFEELVLAKAPSDDARIVFAHGNSKVINHWNTTIFQTNDDNLSKYMGINTNTISLISLTKNRTDFDTWLFNETIIEPNGDIVFDISDLLEFQVKSKPHVFAQTTLMHPQLKLTLDNNIYKKNVNVVLFFRNHAEAMTLAGLIHTMNYSNVTYQCWDILQSDPPVAIDMIPSIGITSKVLEHRIPLLQVEANEKTLRWFIEANLKELAIKEAQDQYK